MVVVVEEVVVVLGVVLGLPMVLLVLVVLLVQQVLEHRGVQDLLVVLVVVLEELGERERNIQVNKLEHKLQDMGLRKLLVISCLNEKKDYVIFYVLYYVTILYTDMSIFSMSRMNKLNELFDEEDVMIKDMYIPKRLRGTEEQRNTGIFEKCTKDVLR